MCKVVIPKIEFAKMANGGMNFELCKTFKWIDFRDLYELTTIAARYKRIPLDEWEIKNSLKGTYYKDINLEVLVTDYDVDVSEVDMAELICKWHVVCKALHKATDGNNTSAFKKQTFDVEKNYTFDFSMSDQIFGALLIEKLIRLNSVYKMPKAKNLKGKEFCKWHNSWRHSTNNCVIFRNVI